MCNEEKHPYAWTSILSPIRGYTCSKQISGENLKSIGAALECGIGQDNSGTRLPWVRSGSLRERPQVGFPTSLASVSTSAKWG